MKKNLILIILLLTIRSLVTAQNGDINRVEVYGGYSLKSTDPGFASEDIGPEFASAFGKIETAHGFNFSVTGIVKKYFGLKFDVSTHRKTFNTTFEGDQFSTKFSIQNYLGGIQVRNNEKDGRDVKPFFHALFGVARQKTTSTATSTELGATTLERKQSNFAMAFGGGLDIKVHKRVDIRIFSIDSNSSYVKDQDFFAGTLNKFALDGMLQNSIRSGFGNVIY